MREDNDENHIDDDDIPLRKSQKQPMVVEDNELWASKMKSVKHQKR